MSEANSPLTRYILQNLVRAHPRERSALGSTPRLPRKATRPPSELPKKLQSPVAALISVPFHNNFELGDGRSSDGFKYTLNTQPVIGRDHSALPTLTEEHGPDRNQQGLHAAPRLHQEGLEASDMRRRDASGRAGGGGRLLMRRLGWLLFGLVVVLALAWAAAALHFTGPRPALLADGLAARARGRGARRALRRPAVRAARSRLSWSSSPPSRSGGAASRRGTIVIGCRTSRARRASRIQGQPQVTIQNVRDFEYPPGQTAGPRALGDAPLRPRPPLVGVAVPQLLGGADAHLPTPSRAGSSTTASTSPISIETRKEVGEEYSAHPRLLPAVRGVLRRRRSRAQRHPRCAPASAPRPRWTSTASACRWTGHRRAAAGLPCAGRRARPRKPRWYNAADSTTARRPSAGTPAQVGGRGRPVRLAPHRQRLHRRDGLRAQPQLDTSLPLRRGPPGDSDQCARQGRRSGPAVLGAHSRRFDPSPVARAAGGQRVNPNQGGVRMHTKTCGWVPR